jgi:hypothetical protein
MAYLPAKKLGLTDARRAALIKTLKLLESGKLKRRKIPDTYDEFDKPIKLKPIKNAFNMENYNYPCGTPACVAGWADHFLKKDGKRPFFRRAHDAGGVPEMLNDIFSGYFGRLDQRMDDITPKQAAKALRKFLEKGDKTNAE